MESSRPPACDRCHAIKVKCVSLDKGHPAACERCARLGHHCTLERRARILGRPRAPEQASLEPQADSEFVWRLSPGSASPGSGRSRSSPRASSRQPMAAGDPSPLEGDKVVVTNRDGAVISDRVFPLTIQPGDPLLSRLTAPRDQALLRITFDKTVFVHRRFVLGLEYADGLLSHLFTSLNAYPDTLLKVLLACAGRFSSKFQLSPYTDANLDYSNCARAVQSLREMEDSTSVATPDLVTLLTLGLGIVTFDLLETGLYAHSISHYTLTLAEHFICLAAKGSGQGPTITDEVGAHLLPLVIMDMYNCLVRRRVPAMRLQLGNTETVDKYIGVCWPLIPYLYDICCVSHTLSSLSYAAPVGDLEASVRLDTRRRLDELEAALLSWSPSIPARVLSASAASEVEILLIQANIYQHALLLVIHRLRYPLGCRDETARGWSCMILAWIEGLHSIAARIPDRHEAPGEKSSFDYRLAFPFLVAAVEVTDPVEREVVLGRLGTVVSVELYSHVLDMMRQAIVHTWGARDAGSVAYLFDTISEGPPLVLF